MKEFETLKKIEEDGSMNQKIKYLSAGMTDNLEKYLRMTFGDIILNVAAKTIENAMEIKTPLKHKDIGERLEWWLKSHNQPSLLAYSGIGKHKKMVNFEDFCEFFEMLQGVSGLEAQEKIKEFFEHCEPVDAKWYARCLMKDLASGMSWTTVNKVFKEKKLPIIETFDISLCSVIDCTDELSMTDDINIIGKKHNTMWMEPKYDGVRIILRNALMLRKKKTEAISRNGLQITSVSFLISEFDRVFGVRKMELDGELIAKDFQTLMTQIHRKNDLNVTMPREFMVFDILSVDGNDVTYMTYLQRRDILEKIFSKVDSEVIKLVKNKQAGGAKDVLEMFDKSVAAGHEGIIVKIDEKYTRDRSAWWKMKPIKTADLKITAMDRTGSGRHAGKVSSIEVTDASGTVVSNVGSGLTDEVITIINKAKDLSEWLGKIAEIRFDSITKPNSEGIRSLRFPRFIKFRFDKGKPEAL